MSNDPITLINAHTFSIMVPGSNGNPTHIPVNLINTVSEVNGRTPPGVNEICHITRSINHKVEKNATVNHCPFIGDRYISIHC